MTVIKLISTISIVLASVSYQSKVLADDPIKQVETKSTQLVDQKILKNVEKILDYYLSLLTETSQEFSYSEKSVRNTFLKNDSIARKKAVNSSNIYYNKSMVKILNAEEKVNGRIATITVDAHEILYLANASYDSLAPSTSEEIAKYEFKFEKNGNSYKLISTKKLTYLKIQ